MSIYLPDPPANEHIDSPNLQREHEEHSAPKYDCLSRLQRMASSIALGTVILLFLNRSCGNHGNYVSQPLIAAAFGTGLIWFFKCFEEGVNGTHVPSAPRLQDVDLRKLSTVQLKEAKVKLYEEFKRRVEEAKDLEEGLRRT